MALEDGGVPEVAVKCLSDDCSASGPKLLVAGRVYFGQIKTVASSAARNPGQGGIAVSAIGTSDDDDQGGIASYCNRTCMECARYYSLVSVEVGLPAGEVDGQAEVVPVPAAYFA